MFTLLHAGRWLRWPGRAAALLLACLVAPAASQAQALIDLRTTFPHVAPYTGSVSPPVVRDFAVPGPGVLHIRLVLAPYYRSMEPLRFRSLLPIDGADESVFRPRVPGAVALQTRSNPERWVDGATLEIDSTVRFSKARPQLEVALFPSVVRFGDGSLEQLRNSVQVELWFEADGAPAPAQPTAWVPGPWASVVETLGAERWMAEWTLLDDGVSLDGSWRHEPGGDTGVNRRFARIVRIDGPQIVIDRPGLGQYTGTVSADRRVITGTVSWAPATWRATLRAPLPRSLGPQAGR